MNYAFAFPDEAGPRFTDTDPGGMKGWVNLVGWLHIYGLPVRKRSPIQVLTGPDVDESAYF